MTEHYLKTWTEPFQAMKSGLKPYELRLNDRDYKVGDTLILAEYLPHDGSFTGDRLKKIVTYILGKPFVQDGYVIMSLGEWVGSETKQRWTVGKINGKERVLYQAVQFFGLEKQMTKAIEECGELIVAIAKMDINNIAEEVADVKIMLDQIEIMLGLDTGMIRQSKLERLNQRICEARPTRRKSVE